MKDDVFMALETICRDLSNQPLIDEALKIMRVLKSWTTSAIDDSSLCVLYNSLLLIVGMVNDKRDLLNEDKIVVDTNGMLVYSEKYESFGELTTKLDGLKTRLEVQINSRQTFVETLGNDADLVKSLDNSIGQDKTKLSMLKEQFSTLEGNIKSMQEKVSSYPVAHESVACRVQSSNIVEHACKLVNKLALVNTCQTKPIAIYLYTTTPHNHYHKPNQNKKTKYKIVVDGAVPQAANQWDPETGDLFLSFYQADK